MQLFWQNETIKTPLHYPTPNSLQSVKSISYAIQNPLSHSPMHSTSKSLQKYIFFVIHNRLGIFFLDFLRKTCNGLINNLLAILHTKFIIHNAQFIISSPFIVIHRHSSFFIASSHHRIIPSSPFIAHPTSIPAKFQSEYLTINKLLNNLFSQESDIELQRKFRKRLDKRPFLMYFCSRTYNTKRHAKF